jgi:hypothetical protein
VLVLLRISHSPSADQNFGTSRFHILFMKAVHKRAVHKTVYSSPLLECWEGEKSVGQFGFSTLLLYVSQF